MDAYGVEVIRDVSSRLLSLAWQDELRFDEIADVLFFILRFSNKSLFIFFNRIIVLFQTPLESPRMLFLHF